MLRKIELTENFRRSFKKLPENVKFQFSQKRLIFYKNPFSKTLKTHKLKGNLEDFWSFSVTYSHRVIFKFVNKNKAVFYDIGDHRIYK
jgi:mRNA-degrading endonuclease YafQ of YafQ-DinJ toxin-antitoxin module